MERDGLPTDFNGTLYRSRLEARWAVFFWALGLEAIYEPSRHDLDDGSSYLPDFLLVDDFVFVEVKPAKLWREESGKALAFKRTFPGRRVAICAGAPDGEAQIFEINDESQFIPHELADSVSVERAIQRSKSEYFGGISMADATARMMRRIKEKMSA